MQVARRLQAALHVAPWSLRVRSAAARALSDLSPAAATAAARLWPLRRPPRAAADDTPDGMVRDGQRVRVSGALAAAGAGSIGALAAELQVLQHSRVEGRPQVTKTSFRALAQMEIVLMVSQSSTMQRVQSCASYPCRRKQAQTREGELSCQLTRACMALQALKQAVHAQPWNAQLLVLAALVSAQLAAELPAARLCRGAELSCSAALAAVQRGVLPVRTSVPATKACKCKTKLKPLNSMPRRVQDRHSPATRNSEGRAASPLDRAA